MEDTKTSAMLVIKDDVIKYEITFWEGTKAHCSLPTPWENLSFQH